jgi:replication factor C subunit 3/5
MNKEIDIEKIRKYLDFKYEDIDNKKEDNIVKKSYNLDLIKLFESLSSDNEMPHILFYGLNGSGKKTMINILLELLFGREIYNIEQHIVKINGSGGKINDVPILKSKYHIVIEPNNNNFDRHMFKEVIKDYAKTFVLNDGINIKKSFKVIQINKLDMLSENAQNSLRRTIEKYSKSCRFVSYCNSLNKIAEPLRSRCLCLNVKNFTNDDNINYIKSIIEKENIKIPLKVMNEIVNKSNGNIKETAWNVWRYSKFNNLDDFYTVNINKITDEIFKKCNIENMREYIYKLTIYDISENKICKDVFLIILKQITSNIKKSLDLIEIMFENETNINKSRRPIKILEYIFIKFNEIVRK